MFGHKFYFNFLFLYFRFSLFVLHLFFVFPPQSIDEFVKFYDNCLSAMDGLQKLLQSHNKSIRAAEADAQLKKNSQMHATVQCSIETVIEMGKYCEKTKAKTIFFIFFFFGLYDFFTTTNNKEIYITFYKLGITCERSLF